MLELKHVSKTFEKNTLDEKKALQDIDITINDGDFVTIIGSNGAGKSTLFNAIAGTFLIDTGKIIMDGKDITFFPEYKRAKDIGRLFQDPLKGTAPQMTIMENLALASGQGPWLGLISKKEKNKIIEKVESLGMGLEKRMHQRVGSLSGGQRQSITLLMATINPPKLLLLDEHTAALDPGTAETIIKVTNQIVCENKLTCLMITHNMEQALHLGNRTIMMNRGKIIMDISGEERYNMTINGLLERFKEQAGREFTNDRILLSSAN